MRAALVVALSVFATSARAQDEESLLDLSHRATAILPAGLVQLESMYVGHPIGLPSSFEVHELLSRLEARVPFEQLLLTASVIEGWMLVRDDPSTDLAHLTGSPQLGASYRDAIGSWRYELGGATTIPIADVQGLKHWERSSMLMSLFPRLPLVGYFATAGYAWGGWNGAQLHGWSIQARARVEVDALPEIVLAGEIVTELLAPQWQTAIEGAYRIDELSLIGLRAQVVVDLGRALELVMLEPTLRMGYLEPVAGLVVNVAIPIVLWPRLEGPLAGALWSVGVRASAGAVF